MARSSPHVRRFLAGSLAIVAGLRAVTSYQAAAVVRPAASSELVHRWTASWSNGRVTVTPQIALQAASQFSVIAAQPGIFKPYVGEMKAANPNLRLLVYVNGLWQDPMSRLTQSYPESWFSHDASGHRITWLGWSTVLMDPTSPGWQAQVGQLCHSALATSGYDGCYIDNLGPGPVIDTRDKSGAPVNPNTAQLWTASGWMAAVSGLVRGVRASSPNIVMIGNGLGAGGTYFSAPISTAPLDDTLDGLVSELFVRGAGTPVTSFKPTDAWKRDVDMVVADQATGDSVFVVVKLPVPATWAQQGQWHKYALASFLLATNGNSYFQFIPDSQPASALTTNQWDHVNPGSPMGPYTQNGAMFERVFTNGIALVNPTDAAATVQLSGRYTTLEGRTVQRWVRLAPHTGDVLVAS
jgi:hypothetical protein